MSIYEYNKEAVMAVIREQEFEFGMTEGEKKGINKAITLTKRLLEDGRQEEILKAAADESYLKKLLLEYGI